MHLFDLPNEILLQIITDELLSKNDLYHLATLSLLLHSLALPAYLRVHGLDNPMSYSAIHVGQPLPHLIKSAPDAISGLAISTDLTSIDHLVCYIHGFRASEQDLLGFEKKIQQLCRVVDRLQRVSRFRICFLGVMSPQSGRRLLENHIRTWTTSIGCLLNKVLNKGCLHLTVRSGCWSEDPYRFRTVKPSTHPFSTIRYLAKRLFTQSTQENILRGLDWEFFRPDEGLIAEPTILPSPTLSLATSALRVFTIQSRIFLIPPYLGWTLSALAISTNITSLTFKITQLKAGIWKITLKRIAEVMSSRLREVRFKSGCYGLDFGDLLTFLKRTPYINTLEVHGRCNVIIPKRCTEESLSDHHCPLAVPHLPNLRVLIAPLCLASHLVSLRRGCKEPLLPHLQEWSAFFNAGKLFGNYAYTENSYQRHSEICERLMETHRSSQTRPIFTGQILGQPYSYQKLHWPDEDQYARAETLGTSPHFPYITKVMYHVLPTRMEQLEAVGSFLSALAILFPELHEIKVPEATIKHMKTVGDGGLRMDEGSARSSTVNAFLSTLQQRFGKLVIIPTEE